VRRPLRLAAVAAAVVVAAGCGSSGRAAAPGFGSTVTIAPPSPGDLIQVVSAARVTLGARSLVSIRLDSPAVLGAAGRTVTGVGSFDFAASQGQAELDRPTGTERVIFVAQSVFVAQPQTGGVLPAGKVWISAGLTEQSLATNFPQFVTQVESLNPGLLLSEVEWGAISAAPMATVGGAAVRSYVVQVDLAKAQSGAGGPSGEAFRRAIEYQLTEMSGATVPTQVTVDVGIDSKGRVAVMRDSPPGAGLGTVTVGLSGFGAAVPVSRPARAQVVDISSLAPGGERENAGGGDSDGA
jgi:hypothetical protein